MSDRPTYKEYACSRNKKVVKTINGRYFAVVTPKIIDVFKVLFCVAWLVTIILLIYWRTEGLVWPHLQVEAQLLFLLLSQWFIFFGFRFSAFSEIPADSEDYAEVSTWYFGKPGFSAASIILVLLVIFVLINSFSVTYLRSVIDSNPQVESINDAAYAEEVHVIPLQYVDSDNTLYIQIIRTSEPAVFLLDGIPLENYSRNLLFSFIWDAAYFRQRYELFMNNVTIHDGSILTLTCGELTREWVFDVPE